MPLARPGKQRGQDGALVVTQHVNPPEVSRWPFLGLAHQHVRRGNVGVPLDQCGLGPDAHDRLAVKLPHGVAHRRAVRIDQDIAGILKPCEVDFAHHVPRMAAR